MKVEDGILQVVAKELAHGYLTVGTRRQWDAYRRELAKDRPHVLCNGMPYLFTADDLAVEGLESGAVVTLAELHAMQPRSFQRALARIEKELAEMKSVN